VRRPAAQRTGGADRPGLQRERRIDPDDRRRMGVRLTHRGRTAATAIQTAIDAIEAELARLVTAEELPGLRAGLAAYRAIRARQ